MSTLRFSPLPDPLKAPCSASWQSLQFRRRQEARGSRKGLEAAGKAAASPEVHSLAVLGLRGFGALPILREVQVWQQPRPSKLRQTPQPPRDKMTNPKLINLNRWIFNPKPYSISLNPPKALNRTLLQPIDPSVV